MNAGFAPLIVDGVDAPVVDLPHFALRHVEAQLADGEQAVSVGDDRHVNAVATLEGFAVVDMRLDFAVRREASQQGADNVAETVLLGDAALTQGLQVKAADVVDQRGDVRLEGCEGRVDGRVRMAEVAVGDQFEGLSAVVGVERLLAAGVDQPGLFVQGQHGVTQGGDVEGP